MEVFTSEDVLGFAILSFIVGGMAIAVIMLVYQANRTLQPYLGAMVVMTTAAPNEVKNKWGFIVEVLVSREQQRYAIKINGEETRITVMNDLFIVVQT